MAVGAVPPMDTVLLLPITKLNQPTETNTQFGLGWFGAKP